MIEQKYILIFENVFYGVMVLLVFAILACIYMLIKNDNTFRVHMKITYAIYAYRMDCIKKKMQYTVDHSDVEEYETTLNRFWYWGYAKLLPKEKFELIKPYIKEEIENETRRHIDVCLRDMSADMGSCRKH